MNKHSKYRPLLDKVELKIARHELSFHEVYQIMLESLDEAETAELALREDLEALRAHCALVKDSADIALNDLAGLLNNQKVNMDDGSYDYDGQSGSELYYAIQQTPAQSLSKVRADAIRGAADNVIRHNEAGFCIHCRVVGYANHIEAGL